MNRPPDKHLGLIDMIRTITLAELHDDEDAEEWLDTNYPDPAVAGLLARELRPRWGVQDKWFAERFMYGDAPVEQVVADLEGFSGEQGLATVIGEIANDIASELVRRRRQQLGQ